MNGYDCLGSGSQGLIADARMIVRFGLGGRDIADRREQAAVIVPLDPLSGGGRDSFDEAPRAASVDHLSLEQAVSRLSRSVS